MAKKSTAAVEEIEPKAQEDADLTPNRTSVMVDGKEFVFEKDQMELFGEPEISRLRKLADAFILQVGLIEVETEKKAQIGQNIMMELHQEGRASFAFRHQGSTYTFEITPTAEKLKVKKE